MIVNFLHNTTLKKIAEATNSKLMINIRFRLFIILAGIIFSLLYILIWLPFIPVFQQYNPEICAMILVMSLPTLALLIKCDSLDMSYIITEDGKKLDIYQYRVNMMHSYFLKEGYITIGRNNQAFYLSVIDSIKDKLETNDILNLKYHLPIIALIIAILSFVINETVDFSSRFWVVYILLNAYSTTLIIYIILLIFRQGKRKSYNLLNSILHDLSIQDAIEYNRRKKSKICKFFEHVASFF